VSIGARPTKVKPSLAEIRLIEESYALGFDEWLERATPVDTNQNVRKALLTGPPVRGFTPSIQLDGAICTQRDLRERPGHKAQAVTEMENSRESSSQ
jgi:hypothetical protein